MQYRTMSNSGTVVSKYALGTMTFGDEAIEETSHAILDNYLAAGGNFIDTADVYSAGGRARTKPGRISAADSGQRAARRCLS